MTHIDMGEIGVLRVLRFVSVLIFFYAFSSLAVAQSAKITLVFKPGQKNVEARFELSQAVSVLRFSGNGEVRLKSWVPLEGAHLNSDGTEILLPKTTKRIIVQLNAFERDGLIDRVYTPVILFGDGNAAQVYSEYLLPKGGGSVNLANPGVVLGNAVSKGTTIWHANDAATYIVTGQANTNTSSEYIITLDNSLPIWIAQSLNKQVAALMDLYTQKFGNHPKQKPWIVASYNPVASIGNLGFRGDTNPGMVRLNLMGKGWEYENTEQSYQLASFVAHELFHLWNAELWRAQNKDPIWLYEGGADAVAQDALYRLGITNADRYRYQRMDSLVGCSTVKGETLANKLVSGGRTHYKCGAAIFYLAAAMSGEKSLDIGPLDLWADLFIQTKAQRKYSVSDLLHVVEKRKAQLATRDIASPQSYLNELIESKLPWSEALANGQQTFRIHQINPKEPISSNVAAVLLDKLVIDRVTDDCKGATSVAYDNQIYQVEALNSCHKIRQSVTLTHLGGHSMRENAQLAMTYAFDQCSKGLNLHFSGKEGISLDLTCLQTPSVPTGLFVPDLDH
ncbi:hypothetical protein H8L32_21560 [Undibacterium sp. CY18W]|uniref:M61 glycyl aminopeptidase n=1 Tax=Undibacterium hunanense TaxID=2762292 RepID=A0ABR6ZWR0_9BURK|nr:hypothetical protein [Undibacterium hunanense]MBC3920069.1 hypothetical protein [Undibacterium hunanense]